MRRFVRENSLSIGFGALFVAALVGQAIAGWKQFNAEQLADGYGRLGLADYLTSADFAVDVAENWQSEYLQFLLYIVLTVWLVQKGSPESKEIDKAGTESAEDQKIGPHAVAHSPRWAKTGDWRTSVYSSSLALVMATIFLLSWLVQSIAGWAAFNETRLEQLQDPISWGSYLLNPDFGSMAVLSIYLRQRGSPESKPVGEPHTSTGVEG
jgi:hypothetical protein